MTKNIVVNDIDDIDRCHDDYLDEYHGRYQDCLRDDNMDASDCDSIKDDIDDDLTRCQDAAIEATCREARDARTNPMANTLLEQVLMGNAGTYSPEYLGWTLGDCMSLDNSQERDNCKETVYEQQSSGSSDSDWFGLLSKCTNAEASLPEVSGIDIAQLAEFLQITVDPATDPMGFVKELTASLKEIEKQLGVSETPVEEIAEEVAEGEEPAGNATECSDLIAGRRSAYDDCMNAGGNDPECEDMVSQDYDGLISQCLREQGINDPAWNALDEETAQEIQDCLLSNDDEYEQLRCLQNYGFDTVTEAIEQLQRIGFNTKEEDEEMYV